MVRACDCAHTEGLLSSQSGSVDLTQCARKAACLSAMFACHSNTVIFSALSRRMLVRSYLWCGRIPVVKLVGSVRRLRVRYNRIARRAIGASFFAREEFSCDYCQ